MRSKGCHRTVAAATAIVAVLGLTLVSPRAGGAVEVDDAPPLARQLVRVADVPGLLPGREERAVSNVLLRSEAPLARSLRRELVLDDAQRSLQAPDLSEWVTVALVRYPNGDIARDATEIKGRPHPRPPTTPAGTQVTVGEREDDFAEVQAVRFDGGVATRIEVVVFGPDAVARADRLVSTVAVAQDARLVPGAERPGSFDGTGIRSGIALQAVGLILVVNLVLGLVTAGRDPAVRRRLRLRLRVRALPRRPAQAWDVEDRVRAALWRHRLVVGLRLVVTSAVVYGGLILPLEPRWTYVLVAVALAGWALVESRLPLAGGAPRRRRTRGWAVVPVGAGVAGSIVLIVLGVGVGMGMAWGAVLGTLGEDVDDQGARVLVLGGAALGLVLVALSVVPQTLARRVAQAVVARRMESEREAPVLLLRSFGDDGLRLRTRRTSRSTLLDRVALRRWERFEEFVATAVGGVGPVEAVGQPGTRLPPLGAVRHTFDHRDWQAGVAGLVERARMIVIVPGLTRGVTWEVDAVTRLGAERRCLYLVPPVAPPERRARLRALAPLMGLAPEVLDWDDVGCAVLGVFVPFPGRPVLITARVADDLSYAAALDLAVRSVGAGSAVPDALPPAPEPARHRRRPSRLARLARRSGPRLPWYRRRRARNLVIAATVAALIPIGAALEPEPTSAEAVIDLPFVPLVVEPESEGSIIAVSARGDIARIDLDEGSARRLDGLPSEPVADAAVGEGWVVVTAAVEGEVAARDLDSGRTWRVPVGGAPRGVEIVDGMAVVALPAADEVVALDLRDGSVERQVDLDGAPWDVARSGGSILVSRARTGSVVVLGPDLDRRATWTAPAGARRLAVAGERAWVLGVVRGTLAEVGSGEPSPRARSDDSLAALAAGGGLVALCVDGSERVLVLDASSGEVRRTLDILHAVGDVLITSSGDVVVTVREQAQMGVFRGEG